MCGRFTLALPAETIRDFLGLADTPVLVPRFNIAPTQSVAVVRAEAGKEERRLSFLRWGLIPHWAEDPAIGSRLINARAETLAQKPAFRSAFRQRRCLIPADGFYEWRKTNGRKQPYHIRRRDGGPLAMAGLWETWQAPDGEMISTCAIITTQAEAIVQAIHDRMPVLLPPAAFALWLDVGMSDTVRLTALLRLTASEDLVAVPVSSRVNRVECDGPDLVVPLSAPGLPPQRQGTEGGSPASDSACQSGSSSG